MTVLYLYPRTSAFIRRDLEMLREDLIVHEHEFGTGNKLFMPWRLIVQLAFLLRHRAWQRTIICHFAGYHSVLPCLIARSSAIILAGSDAANFPNINYGNFRKYLYAKATGLSLRKANVLLPVDGTLIRTEQTYDAEAPREQGVHAFVPDLHTPYRTVHYGFDEQVWNCLPGTNRDPALITCVASGVSPNNSTHYRKGIDLLLGTAPMFPDLRFRVVGSPTPDQYRSLPANVTMMRPMDADHLRSLFCESTFYLQASIMEGFPNALCEAMLCGCIPIVSNVAAMPRIIGESGFVISARSIQMLAECITAANALDGSGRERLSKLARERIVSNYSRKTRKDALMEVTTSLQDITSFTL